MAHQLATVLTLFRLELHNGRLERIGLAYPPSVSDFGRYESSFMRPSQMQSEGSELKAIDEHSALAEPLLTSPSLTGLVQFLQPITAQTDEQAVAEWLKQCRSPVTVENYRKEAERFLKLMFKS